MKQNALEFTVETKRSKAEYLDKKLWQAIRSAETLDPKSCTYNVLTELVVATQEFDAIVQELVNLYDQDKYGGEAPLVSENASLAYAHKLIAEMKNVQKSDKSSETMSVWSRNSRRSGALRASTSSSAVRMRAAGEAVAAKQQDEYERLITEKENEIKQREEEEDKRRQQARAQHASTQHAFISANKRVIAESNPRVHGRGGLSNPLELPDMNITEFRERTKALVYTNFPPTDIYSSTPMDTHTPRSHTHP